MLELIYLGEILNVFNQFGSFSSMTKSANITLVDKEYTFTVIYFLFCSCAVFYVQQSGLWGKTLGNEMAGDCLQP